VFGASEAFSKYVSDATGGKFVISVHPGGELVPPFGVVDAVQQGTIECAHTAPYYFFGKDETFAFDCTIPFGMTSRAMTAWMYEGNGMKLMREFYAQFNIVNFPCGNTGAQMGGWYRKEIKSVKDFEGLKFRVGGFGGRVLAKLGAVPQNIPAGEIYQALEKGTIDAAEWIGPYDDLKLGLHKVAQHYYYPAWWEGSTQFSLYINDKQWNGLSAEYKAIIEQASRAAHVTCRRATTPATRLAQAADRRRRHSRPMAATPAAEPMIRMEPPVPAQ
jgi:TRAP-type mannitol/chloroaromatic compound transport system substrate-binding protein